MLRKAFTASFVLVSFAALAFAQQKPNFSGTWKLNTAKSDFGMLPPPESRTDVITHADPDLKVATTADTSQGKQQFTLNYTTDGKEVVNKMGPREIKSSATIVGNALNVDSKLNFNDQDITIKAKWTLSDDGKVMTVDAHYTSAMGETDQKLIFDKQSGDASVSKADTPKAMAPVVPSTAGGPKPNFSGVWKLNPAKSDFGVLPGPDMRVDTIEHNEPAVKLSRSENGPEGKRDYVLNMSNDGKEVANDLGGAQAKITSNWEGNSHVMVMKLKFQDQDVTIKRVSTLSEDGKTLIAQSHLASAMGELDQKEVYEKQ